MNEQLSPNNGRSVEWIEQEGKRYGVIFRNRWTDYVDSLISSNCIAVETAQLPYIDNPQYIPARDEKIREMQKFLSLYSFRMPPLVLGDVTYTRQGVEVGVMYDFATMTGEATAGHEWFVKKAVGLWNKRDKLPEKVRTIGRRDVLKGLAGVVGMAATVHALPQFLALLAQTGEQGTGWGTEEAQEVIRLNRALHPESRLLLTQMRELIMAEKLSWYMENSGYVQGAALVDVDMVQLRDRLRESSQTRMEKIERLRPFYTFYSEPNSLSTIAELRFDQKKKTWESTYFQVPQLVPLTEEALTLRGGDRKGQSGYMRTPPGW